jgi:hypothetical protein
VEFRHKNGKKTRQYKIKNENLKDKICDEKLHVSIETDHTVLSNRKTGKIVREIK